MNQLDREGIFKGLVLNWGIKEERDSQAVAVVVEFQIVSQLDGDVWTDWSDYEPHSITSYSYIVKKDGSLNEVPIGQLCLGLKWRGDLTEFTKLPPQGLVAQLNVKNETYNSKTRLKVAWINPEDYSPEPQTASTDDVKKLQSRFGGLLRASAGAVHKGTSPAAKPAPLNNAPPKDAVPVAADGSQVEDDKDLPF